MRSFGNLCGTVMEGDTECIDFEFSRGELKKINVKKKPALFEFDNMPVEKALLYFLDDRVVPETRIGLQEYLDRAGLGTFNFERIIRYTKGRDITDKYWIRC